MGVKGWRHIEPCIVAALATESPLLVIGAYGTAKSLLADKIVDFACQRDPLSLVGVEVTLHRHLVVVTGCVTTFPIATEDDIKKLIFEVFEVGYGDDWEPHPKDLIDWFLMYVLKNWMRILQSSRDVR